jgi:hypothetical protein
MRALGHLTFMVAMNSSINEQYSSPEQHYYEDINLAQNANTCKTMFHSCLGLIVELYIS